MTGRDWKEIEGELNGLVPSPPLGEKRPLPNHGVRQAIQEDEEMLLAHIADALARGGVGSAE